jgi:hypothetical protein
MLVLNPSKGLVKITELDFNLINFILNRFIKFKRRTTIKVQICNQDWSGYWSDKKLIKIDIKQGTSLKYIIATLLHEIRHVKQVNEVKNIRFNYENYNEYYNSAEEKDARKYEKLTADVCCIYNGFKRIDEKYVKFNFDCFKELIDNNKR